MTITGSLGNISRKLAEQLIAQGHNVTVISHDPGKIAAIEALGATAAIGSLEDTAFLTRAFTGADAVYTMVPPSRDTTDLATLMQQAGTNYAAAIAAAGVNYVVNLSGIGSHRPTGNGPSGTFHAVERHLNALEGVHVLHLQPAMFYTNFFGSIGLIRQQGVIGNNFDATTDLLLTHPADIADAAAEALNSRSFEGTSIRYVVSDRKNGTEIARELGAATGNPDLQWLSFPDEQLLNGAMQNGFSHHMASHFVEMGTSIRDGRLFEQYAKDHGEITGKIKLSDFAREFAAVYEKAN